MIEATLAESVGRVAGANGAAAKLGIPASMWLGGRDNYLTLFLAS